MALESFAPGTPKGAIIAIDKRIIPQWLDEIALLFEQFDSNVIEVSPFKMILIKVIHKIEIAKPRIDKHVDEF